MEVIIIACVLILYGVGYFVYYMYGRDRKPKRRKKFYDHLWP